MIQTHNPLIVQSNNSLLLEVDNPLFRDARDTISSFAHLEKSPEHIHTYSITPLSLWNAAALGMKPEAIVEALQRYSKYPVPSNVIADISELVGRFGKFVLISEDGKLVLKCSEPDFLRQLIRHPRIAPLVEESLNEGAVRIHPEKRGLIKQALIGVGFPVHDIAGYIQGEPYDFALSTHLGDGAPFNLRQYQILAAESFRGTPTTPGGSGVVVLPCGAGKTVVGIYSMYLMQTKTLILVTNITAARQWRREILEKTRIPPEHVCEYSGEVKDIGPVTLATYQILTYRRKKTDELTHFGVFNAENWGLVVYDEVHLLPAPVFQMTANLQARRRLGLTATLVREDGHEEDVFTLIGPKKYDVPWKELERQGWIASARCVEVRLDLPAAEKMNYLSMPPRQQIRVAYENPAKLDVIEQLLARHKGDRVLIIGQYLTQLEEVSERFSLPMITGSTPNQRRDDLYDGFRRGDLPVLVLSKVGNFAIDLPDANVAIQISGAYGSRQEEAQRLGRILRPKKQGEQAVFYSVVTRESKELDFAMKRQLFLAEQGYAYEIDYWEPTR
jgi:DNA excision repair protein ERCC-3